jgi:hypothetical protein
MKRVLIAGLAVAILSGCVGASVSASGYDSNGKPWSAEVLRVAFVYRMDIPQLEVPGVFKMNGYNGRPDSETVKAVAGAPWWMRVIAWFKGG